MSVRKKLKRRPKRQIHIEDFENDDFVPVYDPIYYNSIELQLQQKEARQDAVYEYLARSKQ